MGGLLYRRPFTVLGRSFAEKGCLSNREPLPPPVCYNSLRNSATSEGGEGRGGEGGEGRGGERGRGGEGGEGGGEGRGGEGRVMSWLK